MSKSPSTDNYTLGKGVVSFNQKDLATGLYGGERDLGNAPAFAFNIALEKLEHFSSRGGLRAKDKEIISQITPGVSFTLDEINKENLALLTLADILTVNQAAGYAAAEVLVAKLGLKQQTAYRKIGSYVIAHGTVTGGPFEVGEAITSAGGGVGTVIAVGASSLGILIESGAFVDAELLTGGTSAATATSSGVPTWNAGIVLVTDSAGTTTYVGGGTDYNVNTALQDDKVGRISFASAGAITADEDVKVSYNYMDYTYNQVQAFKNTQIEGFLRFVSDNPAGEQMELEIWRVSLTPTGDTAMIGDDWSTLGFSGEILKDETNHPESPYFNIIMDEE